MLVIHVTNVGRGMGIVSCSTVLPVGGMGRQFCWKLVAVGGIISELGRILLLLLRPGMAVDSGTWNTKVLLLVVVAGGMVVAMPPAPVALETKVFL